MHEIFYIFIVSIVLRRSNIRLYKDLSCFATNHLLFHFSRFVRIHRRKLFSSIGVMRFMCGLIFFVINAVTLQSCEAADYPVSNSVGNNFNFLKPKSMMKNLPSTESQSHKINCSNTQRSTEWFCFSILIFVGKDSVIQNRL